MSAACRCLVRRAVAHRGVIACNGSKGCVAAAWALRVLSMRRMNTNLGCSMGAPPMRGEIRGSRRGRGSPLRKLREIPTLWTQSCGIAIVRLAGLFTLSLSLSSAALAQPGRVCVVAIGADGDMVGAVQYRIEQALIDRGIQIEPAVQIAHRLAEDKPASAPDERIAVLLEQVKGAYYEDRLDDAQLKLKELAEVIELGRPAAGADRVTLSSWSAAIALAKGDLEAATGETVELLALAPDWQPELDVFRPSFVRFVGRMRVSQPRPVSIRLENIPTTVTLEVDSHLTRPPIWVGPGRRQLRVRAPGLQTVVLTLDAQADQSLVLQPALELGDALQPALQEALWSAELEEAPSQAVVDLLDRLGVDAIAVVGVRDDAALRAALSEGKDAFVRSEVATGEGAVAAIADWLSSVLAPPEVAVKPAPSGSARTNTRPAFAFDAGPTATLRRRTLEDSGGQGLYAQFPGVGLLVEASLRVDAWTAAVRFTYSEYGLSSTEVPLTVNDAAASVDGGRTFRVDLGGGRRLLGSPDNLALTGKLEAALEHHAADDVHFEPTQGFGPTQGGWFTSYSRFALGAGASVEIPTGPIRLRLGGAVHPLHLWSQERVRPSTAAGRPAFRWHLAAALALGTAWQLRAGYLGELRSVAFEDLDAEVEDPFVDPTLSELLHGISVTLVRAL